jgi:hypothetical protein
VSGTVTLLLQKPFLVSRPYYLAMAFTGNMMMMILSCYKEAQSLPHNPANQSLIC